MSDKNVTYEVKRPKYQFTAAQGLRRDNRCVKMWLSMDALNGG